MTKRRLFLRLINGFFLGLIVCLGLLWLFFGRGGEAEDVKWGANFDPYYAQHLGLDWKKTYLSLLNDLGVDNFRLVAFWDAVEPERDAFDFERLDFQIKQAEKRGAKVILGIGRRLPRWPECHDPAWFKEERLTAKDPDLLMQEELLEYLEEVVNRYKDSPAVEYWQVENEPYVWFFGDCPKPDTDFVRREMELVKSLDPTRPILVTESGELSTWFKISRLGEHIGISLYEIIYADLGMFLPFPGYRRYPLPQHYYRIKGNLFKRLGWIKEIFVSELQAEPWGDAPLQDMGLERQYRSFNPDLFRQNLEFARSTGFDRFYLWGAEWWYWVRENHGVEEFLEIAKELWKNTQ